MKDERVKAIEGAAGLEIPIELLEWTPTGDKVLVLVEVPEAMTKGGLIKPEEVIAKETGGSGWIVRLGPEAGGVLMLAAGVERREDLVGAKAVWGKYAGESIVVTDRDDEFRSRFRAIREENVILIKPPEKVV